MEEKIRELVSRAVADLKKFMSDDKWTVYSAFIISDDQFNFKKTVAFGSGIKCLSEVDVKTHPDQLVHDSHAEIICKRSFNCFLLKQVEHCKNSNLSRNEYIEFDDERKRWSLRISDKLIFYTTCSPCGDATIEKYFDAEKDSKKFKFDCGLAEGRDHPHLTGILRTKPGRKDSPQTLSLSCSDKIASWNILGVQCAILTHLFSPIYVDILAVGDGFDLASCSRALNSRTAAILLPQNLINRGYKNNSFDLKVVPIEADSKEPSSSHPKQETSSFWYLGMTKPEHIVQGYKKGSKKPVCNQSFPLSLQSSLSREFIFKKLFMSLIDHEYSTYFDAKISASDYQLAKAHLLADSHFRDWPVRSPEMKKHRESLL